MNTLVDEILLLEKKLLLVTSKVLEEAGRLGVEAARKTKLFKHGSTFDEQIKFHRFNDYSGEVVSESPHSHYLEYGNNQQGQFIYPVRAKALHFFWNGEEKFFHRVKSHGPLPFMKQAKAIVEERLPEIWANNIDKYIK